MALIISGIKYIFVFFIVLFFFKVSEQELSYCDFGRNVTKKKRRFVISKHKAESLLFAFIGIILLCLFAGLRAQDVGVDTSGYPVNFMRIASSSSTYSNFVSNCPDLSNEPIGSLLVYLCSKITKKTWLLLFFYQFLTVTPVYFASLHLKKYISIVDSMAVYLFIFFNNSLNMMRQSVGCAFILYGLSSLLEEKKINVKFVISFVIAALFHRSSIYGILLVLAVYFSFEISKKWLKYIIYVSVICIPILVNSISDFVGRFIHDAHILYYLDVFVSGKVDRDWFINPFSLYSLVYIFVVLGLLLLPYLFDPNFGRKKTRNLQMRDCIFSIKLKLRTMNLVGFLIYITLLLSMETMYGMRFSIFFDYMYMLSIPLSIGNNKSKRKIMYLFLFVAWALWIMRMGWSGSELYHMGI